MSAAGGGIIPLLFTLFGLVDVVIDVVALVICVRYIRLSSSMPLLVLSFTGQAVVAIAQRVVQFTGLFAGPAQDVHLTIVMLLNAISVACDGALALGLLLVFRDLRERFQFMREVHEGTRQK